MAIYLAKYQPLNCTRSGVQAAARFGIPPYVDGSCRREPDLECEYPSISAICRHKLFAPHLNVGDQIVYITMKDFYGTEDKHWRLVARLDIIERFESHPDAAKWYRNKIGKVPSNCMVESNPPLPLSHTSRDPSKCTKGCKSSSASLRKWNQAYQNRADSVGSFLACETVWKKLSSPPILTEQKALEILGSWKRIQARLPIPITDSELKLLEQLIPFPDAI